MVGGRGKTSFFLFKTNNQISFIENSLLNYNRFNQNNSAMLTFQNISINSKDTLERLTNLLPVTKRPFYSLGYVVK